MKANADGHRKQPARGLLAETWLPAGLRFARYRFKLLTTTFLHLPDFKGSTLRGAFGHALKSLTCAQRDCDSCADCTLRRVCVYTRIFEPISAATAEDGLRHVPQPFVLLPPLTDRNEYSPGSTFDFEVTVVGPALDLFPYWVAALEHMGLEGVGRGRGTFRLVGIDEVSLLGKQRSIYDPQTRQVEETQNTITTTDIAAVCRALEKRAIEGVRLNIETYLRIKANGRLQDRLHFPLLVRALLRRLDILSQFYGEGPVEWPYDEVYAEAERIESALDKSRWEDWSRVSLRQKARMKFGGVVGRLSYHGAAVKRFLPILMAGQFLHCGKNTTFGLGAYRIVELL